MRATIKPAPGRTSEAGRRRINFPHGFDDSPLVTRNELPAERHRPRARRYDIAACLGILHFWLNWRQFKPIYGNNMPDQAVTAPAIMRSERQGLMKLSRTNATPARFRVRGMTLVEVVIALLISAIALACMASGYVFSINSAERSGLSLAATARAMERLEETRGAKWDTTSFPIVDELQSTNFPDTVVKLDISSSGSGITYATNVTTIFVASADPLLKGIRVSCIWTFRKVQLMTNSVETVRAPD